MPAEIPFQFDSLLTEARTEEKAGNWRQAAEIYEHMGERYQNQLWMKLQAAGALFKAGDFGRSAELASWINQRRPTVDTLLLEARLKRRQKDFKSALALLKGAEDILAGNVSSDIKMSTIVNKYCKSV